MLYQDGRGVPRNRERAAELFAKAAEMGNASAKYNLALLHVEGRYAEPNLTKAAALMKEAAEAGLPEAQYDYGMMLIEGAGVPPDAGDGGRADAARRRGRPAERPGRLRDPALPRARRDRGPRGRGELVSPRRRSRQPGGAEPLAKLVAVGEGRRPSTSRKPRCGARWPAARASPTRSSTSSWSRSRPRIWPPPRSAPASGRPSRRRPSRTTTEPDIRIIDTRPTTQSP